MVWIAWYWQMGPPMSNVRLSDCNDQWVDFGPSLQTEIGQKQQVDANYLGAPFQPFREAIQGFG